jgi:hypothetical protein
MACGNCVSAVAWSHPRRICCRWARRCRCRPSSPRRGRRGAFRSLCSGPGRTFCGTPVPVTIPGESLLGCDLSCGRACGLMNGSGFDCETLSAGFWSWNAGIWRASLHASGECDVPSGGGNCGVSNESCDNPTEGCGALIDDSRRIQGVHERALKGQMRILDSLVVLPGWMPISTQRLDYGVPVLILV